MARRRIKRTRRSTIVVVDDQDDFLDATRVLLEREGHRVLTCTNGADVLATLAVHEIALVLVDYHMPMMSGAELIKAIRANDRYIQIVLQTGFAGPKPPRDLLAELDIQGYHNKADGPEALLMWVDVALKAHELLQELRDRERAQADLVANVSHEFRTPLNIIGGYADILLDGGAGPLTAEADRTVRAIAHTNRTLGQLVDNFLQFARVDGGMVAASTEPVHTAQLVKELAALGGVLVKAGDVAFEATAVDVPEVFASDGVKLRTILRNLIGNAAKFTQRGSVTLEVVGTPDTLLFHVRDTGPGIAANKLAVVFEPFRQLEDPSVRGRGGVGLGLALSHRLAEILGGGIRLVSTVDVGSTFTLSLPRRELTAPTGRSESTRGAA